jgi:repressor LexA
MESISDKQRQILNFVGDFTDERGYPPSVRDIVRGCGISSTSVAQYHINVLRRRGYIRRDPDVSRSIALVSERVSFQSVPLLGTIAAGAPIPVPTPDTWASTPEETLEVPEYLTDHRERLYGLRVKGTSMIDALISDGDIVIMQAASTAEDGEMVAVWLKDREEVTLKKLYHEQGRIRLQPANALMEPIYTRSTNVEIQGKVVAVLRKL